MIKKIQIIVLFLILSCGTEHSKNTQTTATVSNQIKKSVQKEQDVCDLLNKILLKELYPNATDFKQKYSKNTYPTCDYTFKVNGKTVKAHLSFAKGFGSLKNFDNAMNVTKKYLSTEMELLNNVGQKAYYIPKLRQVSAWEGKSIIHVNIGNNKEKTIAATLKIFKKL